VADVHERPVLVTGATGNVGGELVELLTAASAPVRAFVRSPESPLPPGVERAVGNLDEPATVAAALAGVRAVFLLPGYRDMPGLLAQVRGAGVDRVVLLSTTAAASGDTTNAITEFMVRSEAAVRAAGVPWTILRPTGFMSNSLRWRPQLRAGDVVRVPFTEVAIASIDPHDIAAVAVAALVSPGHGDRIHTLTGPQAPRPADQVEVLADVLGRPLRLLAQPADEAWTEMSRTMPERYVQAFFRYYRDGELDESRVLPTVQKVTGKAPRTFRDWAVAHIDAFA
jgi:uncharacterized protein YbjT (DUF2867 family)